MTDKDTMRRRIDRLKAENEPLRAQVVRLQGALVDVLKVCADHELDPLGRIEHIALAALPPVQAGEEPKP